jgi:hypothetical protein
MTEQNPSVTGNGEVQIRTDDDGEPIVPETVAGYQRSSEELTESAVWEAPTRVGRSYSRPAGRDIVAQKRVYIIVDHDCGNGRYTVELAEATDKPYSGDVILETIPELNETAALEAAVEWMQANPAPTAPETVVDRTLFLRSRMRGRHIGDQAEAIRPGTVVSVDDLPPATVVETVSESSDDSPTCVKGDVWVCEMYDGQDQFKLFVEDSYNPCVGYTRPGYDDCFVTPRHLHSDNEDNLRESVRQDTYQWLKEREGETVLHDGDGKTVTVKELSEVRDGAINPDTGRVDPDNNRGIFVDDSVAGEFYPCPFDVDPGTYRVTGNGLVPSSDRFGADVHVSPETWDEHDVPKTTDEAPSTAVELSVTLPEERDGVSRDDPVTELIGVGESTAEELWKDTIGPLYDDGFPVPFVSSQYVSRAIAEMMQVDGEPRFSDAIRAVVGMLGGVAFQDDERAGSCASCVAGNIELESATSGWLSYETAIRAEYCPSWIDVPGQDASVTALGVGKVTPPELDSYIASHRYASEETTAAEIATERAVATDVLESVIDDDLVALTAPDQSYVTIPKRPLEIASTIAQCDPLAEETTVTYWPIKEDEHSGFIHLDAPDVEWSVVLDTSNWLSPESLEEQLAEQRQERSHVVEKIGSAEPATGD